MYLQIGSDRFIRIKSVIAILPVREGEGRSAVVTEQAVHLSPYRAQTLIRKAEEGRL
ncbi:hypothetical protein [Indiicoccus explosivorum]|uniref:hypothetical protein n=1 Tax=Indiicoccus explosivorum TaxID=1917864 RepID=UPI0012D846EA|nr:hypothetical protein [Indiicoccus explosivorum]